MRWFFALYLLGFLAIAGWAFADTIEYDRKAWRHWSDLDGNKCDTRNDVLAAESLIPVVRTDNGCTVVSGLWVDLYTGKTFYNPKQLDVDHFVPLSNANLSGGSSWTAEKKEEYANYQKNSGHLIAVDAAENRQKGGKSPDQWMPKNKQFHCAYVTIWTSIKKQWELSMTEAEQVKIENVLKACTGEGVRRSKVRLLRSLRLPSGLR